MVLMRRSCRGGSSFGSTGDWSADGGGVGSKGTATLCVVGSRGSIFSYLDSERGGTAGGAPSTLARSSS